MSDMQTIIPPPRSQRPMAIKNLVPRLPERGHIKIGIKGEMITSQRGNRFQLPEKLDHFRVTTLERGKDGNFLLDDAFHAKYGDRPTEIPVRLLYDSPELNFPTRYACFIGRTLWCAGDGEAAIRLTGRPDELKTPGSIAPREVVCTCPRQEAAYSGQDKCKMNGSLSVLIEGMGGVGGVWRFRTTSYNSIVGILSSMGFLRSVTSGILANIPLLLRLQPKQAANPQNPVQSVTIYVVNLEFPGDIADLQQYAHRIALDRATTHVSIAHIEEEARRLLALPAPENVVLPGDDTGEVVDEFYPEQAAVTTEGAAAAAPPRPTRDQFASPQAPLPAAKEEVPPPLLSEAEEAELAALVVSGDTAAAEGRNAFLAFWNDTATKSYRAELQSRLGGWIATAKTVEESSPSSWTVLDLTGEPHEYYSLDRAEAAFEAALRETEKQNGAAGIVTLWENNAPFFAQLEERGHLDVATDLNSECDRRRRALIAAEYDAAQIVPRGTAETLTVGPAGTTVPDLLPEAHSCAPPSSSEKSREYRSVRRVIR